MPFFDMSLDELQAYRPKREEQSDFDAFWQETLAETRAHDLAARFEPVDYRHADGRDVRRHICRV
jgi:cephalosporin-C deacetylase